MILPGDHQRGCPGTAGKQPSHSAEHRLNNALLPVSVGTSTPFFQQLSFFYGFLCYPVGLLIRFCHEAKRILLFLFSRAGLDQLVFYHHCLLCEHLSRFHGSPPLPVSSSDHGGSHRGLCFRFHSIFMKKTEEGSPKGQNTALKYPRSSQSIHYQMT